MARPVRFEPRVSPRVVTGALSVLVHLGLFLLLASTSGRFDGLHEDETSITRLVLIESPRANRRDGIDAVPREPVVPAFSPPQQLQADATREAPSPIRESQPEPAESDNAMVAAPTALAATADTVPADVLDPSSTFVLPQAQKSALMQSLTRLAEELAKTSRAQVTWEQDGKQYQAALVLERASNGVEFDHVVAEVSAEDHGRLFKTQIRFKRLAFSHYTQVIDRWDPRVQLHDDEIVGRFHVNSRFNLLYDGRTTPRFLGKVTTAASSFSTQAAGRRREAEIFRGGIETGAGRIDMPQELQPFEWAPRDENVRIHEFENDTRIRFFADGSYTWRQPNADAGEYRNEPTGQPVYFIATRGATLYVQGIVCGKILVYSPRRIVVEGSLTYAHDPRDAPGSDDYLGLVGDDSIEVASSHVTGPGDIDIQAAIFAGRRFTVRDIDHPRTATLRIYGSLAAGSVSATEPRYATRIEYDSRFEYQRPPGFPSTSRFAAEDWDGRWQETSQRSASETF